MEEEGELEAVENKILWSEEEQEKEIEEDK